VLPKFTIFRSDMPSPNRVFILTDKDDPSSRQPNTERVSGKKTLLRIESVLPSIIVSITESVLREQTCTIPATERVDPMRWKDLIETQEPTLSQSMRLMLDPMQTLLLRDKADPSRTASRAEHD
jgi:hypothetical protein